MNRIRKVSDITAEDVANYIRLGELTEADKNELNNYIHIARTYVRNYTGLDDDKIDTLSDLVLPVLVLCQDMYDNREYRVDKTNVNPFIESILGLHSVNLL